MSNITPGVSDQDSSTQRTGSSLSARIGSAGSSVPQSAMNPAYEYALPTNVARMMGGPILETEEEMLLENLKAAPRGGTSIGGGGKKPAVSTGSNDRSPQDTRLPSLAMTQPGGTPSLRGVSLTDGSFGSGGGRGSVQGAMLNTEPAVGAALDGREGSLHAQSEVDAPGTTIVVAPYDVTQSTHSRTVETSVGLLSRMRTVDGTISSTGSWDGSRTSGTPPPVTDGGPDIHGIHMGRVHDGATTSDGAPARAAAVDAGQTGTDVPKGDPRIRRLHRLLDGFAYDDLFLGRYELLGRDQRRRGGASLPRASVCF